MKRGLLLVVLFILSSLKPVLAVDFSADMASSYQVIDPAAATGDVMINTAKGLVRANTEYNPLMFGVFTDSAAIVMRSADPSFKPISRSGISLVNVTTVNGPIIRGSYVTTSAIPGKGMRASMSGYVLGTAMADLTPGVGEKQTINGKEVYVGAIPVAMKIEYAEISNARTLARLMNYLTADLFKNVQDQGQFQVVMRYMMSGLVMLTCMVISFITFSRSVPKAIEAIGRNPLAKSSIMLGLAMSIGLVVATLGLGLVTSIVILRI